MLAYKQICSERNIIFLDPLHLSKEYLDKNIAGSCLVRLLNDDSEDSSNTHSYATCAAMNVASIDLSFIQLRHLRQLIFVRYIDFIPLFPEIVNRCQIQIEF